MTILTTLICATRKYICKRSDKRFKVSHFLDGSISIPIKSKQIVISCSIFFFLVRRMHPMSNARLSHFYTIQRLLVKKCIIAVAIIIISLFGINPIFGQTKWKHIDDPTNQISLFTTNIPYVGASFVEVNGDNNVDIFANPRTVYLNNGDGTFSSPIRLPYTPVPTASGSSWADIDNDGDNDCLVSGVPSRVFENNGLGGFIDLSAKVPSFENYGAWSTSFGDFNEDPYLDFIFAHANGFHPAPATPTPCRLYIQKTNRFEPDQLFGYEFLTKLAPYTCPFWSDYDLDGDMDLFIASGPATGEADYDYCYKNMKVETGKDTLIRLTTDLFALQKQDGQCYNFIDYDNDGYLDLCLTNYYSTPTRLYKNNNGVYESIETPFTFKTTNLANCWGDYDNDGDLDVIITNDNQISKYYSNLGDGTFSYLPDGFTTPTATCGISNADYDNDGDLDVFTNGIGNNGNTSSVGLYRNDSVALGNNWVNFHLIGVNSNRSAIGAIIRIYSQINGKVVAQMREINAHNSFQGQNDLRVHFGLNTSELIDSIAITWPSGYRELHNYYLPNSFYQVTEGQGITVLSIQQNEFLTDGILVYPNPTLGLITLNIDEMDRYKKIYSIIDLSGRVVATDQLGIDDMTISTSQLSAGIYFIKVYVNHKLFSTKFIKE